MKQNSTPFSHFQIKLPTSNFESEAARFEESAHLFKKTWSQTPRRLLSAKPPSFRGPKSPASAVRRTRVGEKGKIKEMVAFITFMAFFSFSVGNFLQVFGFLFCTPSLLPPRLGEEEPLAWQIDTGFGFLGDAPDDQMGDMMGSGMALAKEKRWEKWFLVFFCMFSLFFWCWFFLLCFVLLCFSRF